MYNVLPPVHSAFDVSAEADQSFFYADPHCLCSPVPNQLYTGEETVLHLFDCLPDGRWTDLFKWRMPVVEQLQGSCVRE